MTPLLGKYRETDQGLPPGQPAEAPQKAKTSIILPGTTPARMHPPAFSREDFLSLGPVASHETSAARIDDNNLAWSRRWKMMEGAQKSLTSTYFIWERDIFGYAMLGHMLKKQRQGVSVKLMLDATGDAFGRVGFTRRMRGKDYLQELVESGASVGIYRPTSHKIFTTAVNLLNLFDMFNWQGMGSNHDKIIAVDGREFMTGGRNISKPYFADPRDYPSCYRDTDAIVRSRAATTAAKQAVDVEFRLAEKVRPDLLGNWSRKDVRLLGAYVLMDTWLNQPQLSEGNKQAIRRGEAPKHQLEQMLLQVLKERLPLEMGDKYREPSSKDLKMFRRWAKELVSNPELCGSNHRPQPKEVACDVMPVDTTSSSMGNVQQLSNAIIEIASRAKQAIYIENPYVVLTDRAMSALAEAGKRGVKIYIGTNSPASTDSAATQAFFLEQWPRYLAKIPNLRVFVATGKRKLHAKTATADNAVTFVSTFNLDLISARVNSEFGVLIWSPEIARSTRRSFIQDMRDLQAFEYKIQRDKDGNPLRDSKGNFAIAQGPADHLTPKLLRRYRIGQWIARWATRLIPHLKPLRG